MKYNEIMNEEAVLSSWIDELVYDEDEGICTMILLNGREYDIPIPEEVYQEWLYASSKGSFWHTDIKDIYT